MSQQLLFYQINKISRPRSTDPIGTRFVFELFGNPHIHRTCLDRFLRIIKDEIIEIDPDFEEYEARPFKSEVKRYDTRKNIGTSKKRRSVPSPEADKE